MAASKMLVWEDPRRIDKAGHLIFPDGQNRGRGTGALDQGQFDREEEVLWPDGCAAMYRKRMLDQIGGFDEDFFAYGDDAELGLRARIAGWRCCYAPHAVVRHHRGSTLGKGSARAAGADRAQSRAAGGEAVSVEPAVAEPVLLRGAPGGGRGGGRPRRGRHGALPGPRAASCAWPGAIAGGRSGGACAWCRACCASARRSRGMRQLSPGEVRRLIFAQPARAWGKWHERVPGVRRHAGRRRCFAASDRLYHTTAEEFAVVRCAQCGMVRLDPQPPPEELHRYYPGELLVRAGPSAASRLEEAYRRLVLRDHVRFVARALAGIAARADRCWMWAAAAGCFWA